MLSRRKKRSRQCIILYNQPQGDCYHMGILFFFNQFFFSFDHFFQPFIFFPITGTVINLYLTRSTGIFFFKFPLMYLLGLDIWLNLFFFPPFPLNVTECSNYYEWLTPHYTVAILLLQVRAVGANNLMPKDYLWPFWCDSQDPQLPQVYITD